MTEEQDITDEDILDQDLVALSATVDMLPEHNSPMSSKRSQSFGAASLPSPPESKRPRLGSSEPEHIDLLSDDGAEYIDLVSDDDGPAVSDDPPVEAEPVEVTVDRLLAEYTQTELAEELAAEYTRTEPPMATVDRLMVEYTQGVPKNNCNYKKNGKEAEKHYYIVLRGHQEGIYLSWDECKLNYEGYKGQEFKGVPSYQDAVECLENELKRLSEKTPPNELRILLHKRLCKKPHETLLESLRGKLLEKPREELLKLLREKLLERHGPSPAPAQELVLCQEQQDAMDLAMQGCNLFITGSGGCGKSVLIKALKTKFEAMHKKVHLVAPTGVAAVNIGGSTTFNYAGWTADDVKKPNDQLFYSKCDVVPIKERLWNTDVIIIDEISMIENQFFDRLSQFMTLVRQKVAKEENKTRPQGPFGGVQVIAVGDFCQLPPVQPFGHCVECGAAMESKVSGDVFFPYSCPAGDGHFKDQDKWAFKSPEWNNCKFKYVQLKKIHRQQDEQFIRVLQKCRLGKNLDTSDVNLLLKRDAQTENRTLEIGTCLFSHREKVRERNDRKFNKLPGGVTKYTSLDEFRFPEDDSKNDPRNDPGKLAERVEKESDHFSRHRYPKLLKLKPGMPVILLANIDLRNDLCNGSQGVIHDFVELTPQDMPKEPQTHNFIKNPDGYLAAKERYRVQMKFINSARPPKKYPVVEFANGHRRVICPDASVSKVVADDDKSSMPDVPARYMYGFLSRTQIPLAPGWALTIHKSQGMSLDHVIVNLNGVFAEGQAYVALSRARTLQGLKIEGTSAEQLRRAIKLDPEVKRFMEHLDKVKDKSAGDRIPGRSSGR